MTNCEFLLVRKVGYCVPYYEKNVKYVASYLTVDIRKGSSNKIVF